MNVKFCKKKLLNNFEVKNCKDYELKFKIKTIKTKKKILMIYSKCLILKWQFFDILAKTVKLLRDQNKNRDGLG